MSQGKNVDISVNQEMIPSHSTSYESVSTGEKFAILLFAITCIQAALLKPDITLVVGERAKLFTGLLCALSLVASVLLVKKPLKCGTVPEIAMSVLLSVIILLSGLMSSTRCFIFTQRVGDHSICGRWFLVRQNTPEYQCPAGSVH